MEIGKMENRFTCRKLRRFKKAGHISFVMKFWIGIPERYPAAIPENHVRSVTSMEIPEYIYEGFNLVRTYGF